MNTPCKILEIDVPRLEEVRNHREATTYSLLLVALLESGEPMTLVQVAKRFEQAGVAPFEKALISLKRSRPGRAPVYRNGDLYSLDPYDDNLDLWAFRLGLRPSKASRLQAAEVPLPTLPRVPPPEPEPVPGLDVPVTPAELEEAFTGAALGSWSTQRLACLLLEAHGEPMHREQASDRLSRYTPYHRLRADWPNRWTYGGVREDEDGFWTFFPDHPQVASARKALRERLTKLRAEGRPRREIEVEQRADLSAKLKARREEERRTFEALRRCLLFAFPRNRPAWIVRLDLATREMRFFEQAGFSALRSDLEPYEWIGALEVRPLLGHLGFDPGVRHLAELGPPQKTLAIAGRRPLKITAQAMIRGCSNVVKPLGDEKKMLQYLDQGKDLLLKRQLAKATRSLYGLYHYCKLHGAARVTRGDVDEMIRVPWVHRVEWTLYDLKQQAFEHNLEIEAALGPSLSLEDPWRGSHRLHSIPDGKYRYFLVTRNGGFVPEWMVLAARLVLGEAEAGSLVH